MPGRIDLAKMTGVFGLKRKARMSAHGGSPPRLNGSAAESVPLLNPNASTRKTLWKTALRFLAMNYLNVLLPIVPAALIVGYTRVDPTVVFVLNFIAIIPLAAILSDSTEELAVHVGHTLGGLLNATFGNATELIISIFALLKGEIRIVQASMLGSILSNVLLVLGMCFFFGGLKHKEQKFNSTAASTMASLMVVASSSLVIPAALYQTLAKAGSKVDGDTKDLVLTLSRGTSIVILCIYFMYIWFQFKSHSDFFQSAEEEDEEPVLSKYQAAIILLVATVVVAFCAEHLVATIDSIVESAHLSKTFIGLILIPIVGNAAEHVTSVVVAMQNKMDLAVNIALGSGLQIALLITPLLVLLGWAIGQPMSLYFQTFETVVFFISILLANYHIQDGKSNYLEGAMLMGLYIIISISFFVYPDNISDMSNLL